MSDERIYLTVPFAEKDEAKALGARWDKERKAWWITAKTKPEIFAKWSPSTSGNAPVFLDLDSMAWALEDIELMQQANSLGEIIVFFVPWECWKCHKSSWIFHAAIDYEGNELLGGTEVSGLMYWPDVLIEIDEARASLGLPRMGVIKPRFSKTVGEKYVSQGCAHCDALVGEFPLREDFITIAGEGGLPGYEYKMSPRWPPAGLEEWIERHPEVMHPYDVDDDVAQ